MCDTSAYLVRDGVEEKVLESVEVIEVEGDDARLINIYGEQKTLRARLKLFDNSQGKLVFEACG
jgi:predicted RNA-binding protein